MRNLNCEHHMFHPCSHGPNVAERSAMQGAAPTARAPACAQRKRRCIVATLSSTTKWCSPIV
eukprot:2253427-Pyramimonas_sp.AAC.1